MNRRLASLDLTHASRRDGGCAMKTTITSIITLPAGLLRAT